MGISFLLAARGHADLRCCYMFGTGLVRDLGRRDSTSYMYGDERGGLRFAIDRNRGFVTVGVGGREAWLFFLLIIYHP